MKLDKDGYTPLAEYVTVGGGSAITDDMRNVSFPAKVGGCSYRCVTDSARTDNAPFYRSNRRI